MKRLVMYIGVVVLLIATVVVIYFYREYLGEDTPPTTENQPNPLIRKRLNAVVRQIATAKAGTQPTIDVAYTDLDTKEAASFQINDQYRQSLHVGDTVTKDKWDKILFVYQKDGKMATVPID